MQSESLGFGARLSLAFKVFFDGKAAFAAQRGITGQGEPAAVLPPAESGPTSEQPPAVDPEALREAGAVHMLALLQRDGRLVDFLTEDVAAFSDADIGAAARVVHEGCKKALGHAVDLVPVRDEDEGARVTVPADFDPSAVLLTGNVTGEAPYTGTLAHAGWRATAVRLPAVSDTRDAGIIAAAEVEL